MIRTEYIYIVLLLIAMIVVVVVWLISRGGSNINKLDSLWQSYLTNNIINGRTIDQQHNSDTTSEGQSYTMIRSVWQNDPQVFSAAWRWTQQNLQLPNRLFGWLWGRKTDGSYGILTSQGGEHTAADADSLIALSLILAARRWHNGGYLTAAESIIRSIWQQEVVIINGQPLMAADNIEKTASANVVIVNPSYFQPYAYRLFAVYDKADNWSALVNNSYLFMAKVSAAKLGSPVSDGLPPNWVAVNRYDGRLSKTANQGQNTHYGFNALRVPWQFALDYAWFHDPRDKQLLAGFSFIGKQWSANHRLWAIYSHAGKPEADYSSLAMYGGALGYFKLIQPDQVMRVIASQFDRLFKGNKLTRPLSYYDNNWVWFGMALSGNQLAKYGSQI